ncbi:MAG: TonB-dependent receptor [Tannerellaceae bacterium]|nr:TonB-dependent receptor [Tannerellaceae bacterium]
MNITLREKTELLSDVVVIGYGTAKKTDFTGSLTTITGDAILASNKQSAAAAIQGTIPGVDIVKSGNYPGAGFDIMIRGQNTVAKVGSDGDNTTALNGLNPPLYVIDGIMMDNMQDISPDDIERIDVLKDASSTAIYGSRGANGVVLITTKKGREGKAAVEYNGFVSFTQATNLPEMMNGEEWANYRVERYIGNNWRTYDGSGNRPTVEDVFGSGSQYYKNYRDGNSVDYVDALLKTAVSHNHSVRLYGSGTGLVYSFGAGYTEENGVTGVENYKRYTFSASIDKEINSKLKAGINLYATYTERVETPETIRQAYRLNPLTDMFDEEGALNPFPDNALTNVANPLTEKDYFQRQTKGLRTFGNLYLEYKPMDWLNFKTTFSPNVYFDRMGEYRGVNSKTGRGSWENTRAYYNTGNNIRYAWTNVLSADKQFGDHSLNGMVGSEWEKDLGDTMDSQVRGFTSDYYLFYSLQQASNRYELNSYYEQEQWMSYFARFNYTYKGKYMLTLTGRYDGSSKLSTDNRWKFFPSAALAWRVNEEAFMKDVSSIDNLKLRLSYGKSGNNNSIRRYTTTSNITSSYYVFGDNEPTTASRYGFSNQNLTWETTNEVNLGIDFSFFNYRLNGSVDLYNRRTNGILMDRVMSIMNGANETTDNVGTVDNRGIELSLSSVNLQTRDFKWTTSLNFTTNKNKLVRLSDGSERDEANGWFVGQSIGVIWNYEPVGFWSSGEADQAAKYGLEPGSIKVREVNGDTESSNEDKVFRGSAFPTWTGGMTNTFTYRDIDLSIFIYTRQGQWSYSQFHRTTALDDNERFNKMKNLNYWTYENQANATWHRPGVNPGMTDALMYMKTSFTKIGYITLGYNMPKKVLQNTAISKFRVYASCQNPFVFTNYEGWDPETASMSTETGYMMTRSFVLGLNLTF